MTTKCKECGEEDDDIPISHGLCRVCWEFEHHPETFTLTKEESAEMEECSRYIQKHNISPNLDSIY